MVYLLSIDNFIRVLLPLPGVLITGSRQRGKRIKRA
jgi:hypothetical protein